MSIFKVSRNTIYNWFNDWESKQLAGLYNQPGRGRKKTFTDVEEKQIIAWVNQTPKDLEKVQNKIEGRWKKPVSKETIKRIIKKKGMRWHRIRLKPAGIPIASFYERKVKELSLFKKQEKKEK